MPQLGQPLKLGLGRFGAGAFHLNDRPKTLFAPRHQDPLARAEAACAGNQKLEPKLQAMAAAGLGGMQQHHARTPLLQLAMPRPPAHHQVLRLSHGGKAAVQALPALGQGESLQVARSQRRQQPLAPVHLEPAGWIPLERGVVFPLLGGVFHCVGTVQGLAQQLGALPFIQAEAVEVPEQFGPLLGLEPQLGEPLGLGVREPIAQVGVRILRSWAWGFGLGGWPPAGQG